MLILTMKPKQSFTIEHNGKLIRVVLVPTPQYGNSQIRVGVDAPQDMMITRYDVEGKLQLSERVRELDASNRRIENRKSERVGELHSSPVLRRRASDS